jgi:hypothetical protein
MWLYRLSDGSKFYNWINYKGESMKYCKCKKAKYIKGGIGEYCFICHLYVQSPKSKKLSAIAKKAVRGKDGRFTKGGFEYISVKYTDLNGNEIQIDKEHAYLHERINKLEQRVQRLEERLERLEKEFIKHENYHKL